MRHNYALACIDSYFQIWIYGLIRKQSRNGFNPIIVGNVELDFCIFGQIWYNEWFLVIMDILRLGSFAGLCLECKRNIFLNYFSITIRLWGAICARKKHHFHVILSLWCGYHVCAKENKIQFYMYIFSFMQRNRQLIHTWIAIAMILFFCWSFIIRP